MHWNHQTLHKVTASSDVLAQKGQGLTFFYISKKLGENLWGLFGFHQEALVFLGLSNTEESLENVLEDAKSRPLWKKVQWKPFHPMPTITTLELWGTPFQVAVWQALLAMPEGIQTTYQALAHQVKRPKAVRAVGTAVGSNPLRVAFPAIRCCQKAVRLVAIVGGKS